MKSIFTLTRITSAGTAQKEVAKMANIFKKADFSANRPHKEALAGELMKMRKNKIGIMKLDDDELDLVSAAGVTTPEIDPSKEKKR